MENNSILKLLANERLDSVSEEVAKAVEYNTLQDQAIEIEQRIKDTWKAFEEIKEINLAAINIEIEAAYIQGLKDGLNLISEAKEAKLCANL